MAKAVFQSTILNPQGGLVPFATVEVRAESDNSLAQLYTDRAGASPIAETGIAKSNSQGFVRFYVAPGRYKITASLGTGTRIWRDTVLLDDPGSAGTVTADNVSYDHTTSGLAATDVQAAIDEIAGGGGGGGTTWQLTFRPFDNEPPSSNYATLDLRNQRAVLDFDTSTQEAAIFTSVLPNDYGGGGITVDVFFSATSATSGTIGWDVAVERIDASSLDIDSDSFATAATVTAVTVPGTSGQILKSSVNIANGSAMDSLAAGELFRLRIRRDVANDTATGDAELLAVSVREQ
jgi:hypothetical protein